MKNNIVAVVVTYNRKELLKECIEELTKNQEIDFMIIDNASTDGTADMVKNYTSDKLFYVNTGENLGGAGGFNFGIKEALKHDNYDYIWIMDDDTIVHEDSLEKLVEKAELLNGEFSFLSSVALWKDETLCNMNIQKTSYKTIEHYSEILKGILYIDYASFVSCFINVKSIKEVGLPIKEFFIYGDDMEYTMRLNTHKPGYLVPDSIVTHKMNSNEGINIVDADASRIERYFYNYRNLLFIYKKYDKREYRIFKLKCYYLILKIMLKSKNNKLKRARTIIKALIKARNFKPQIEKI